ncbi:hypothetical protein GT204_10755 [Streptomyces sp. SID4919]|uniref:hypothetical protein n=1 Tax=Streptomyces sp. SID4919 TaxID=2690270 RepID=UPI000C075009|nr:hypothetical protein [Streptomyces sp. SID4919]MYY09378.1 hypothetical protein [Streptomyces sp. SID4919]
MPWPGAVVVRPKVSWTWPVPVRRSPLWWVVVPAEVGQSRPGAAVAVVRAVRVLRSPKVWERRVQTVAVVSSTSASRPTASYRYRWFDQPAWAVRWLWTDVPIESLRTTALSEFLVQVRDRAEPVGSISWDRVWPPGSVSLVTAPSALYTVLISPRRSRWCWWPGRRLKACLNRRKEVASAHGGRVIMITENSG